jgi:hypothetical protein
MDRPSRTRSEAEAEALYMQLGQLISEMPDLSRGAPITPAINRWLARAAYLVTEAKVGIENVEKEGVFQAFMGDDFVAVPRSVPQRADFDF